MADLSTNYLGLQLKNPLVVGSSKLTSTLDHVKKCEDAGAGAVVLKSLFEEQIVSDSGKMMDALDVSVHAEAYDYSSVMSEEFYLDGYLKLVEDAKKSLDIPVIASLNCVSAGKWLDYASSFESVNADALELNVFIMPADAHKTVNDIESVYIDIAKKITRKIQLPVAMKIGSHFTALSHMMHQLENEGIRGLVLFNRFYRPDIDIEKLELKPSMIFSTPEEFALSLQWVALMSGELECDLAASTGIHDGSTVIKQLLAGAKCTQLCSSLYKNGLEHMQTLLKELEEWMDGKNYKSIKDFNGILCQEKSENPESYERSQFIRAVVGIS